jgi:GT2 family glycosyltransferase
VTPGVPAPVSIIVVSRNRPAELRRCLTGLRQLYYPNFEIVVVADSASLPEIEPVSRLRTLAFDAANISAARNAGARAAGGEILAFIDDDAVPEPTWLDHLAAPFDDDRVAAAGGYVIGRNGISLQWGAMCLDRAGWSHPLEIEGEEAQVFSTAPGGRAIRTQGTNMAVRRTALANLGGFDEAYRYYHDDADLNLRIAEAGLLTAVVPRARVHHATAASERRRSDRAPLDLTEIGASAAVFHRKYLPAREWAEAREDLARAERRRLTGMLIDGRLEPKSFERLLKSLLAGYDEGLMRAPAPGEIGPAPAFRPLPPRGPARHEVFAGSRAQRGRLRAAARAAVAGGAVATVIALDPSPRFHRVRFDPEGYWEQSGGRFGRAERSGPLVSWCGLDERLGIEAHRAARYRAAEAAATK